MLQALSKDDGATWRIKPLPVGLPHETDRMNFSTLGYSLGCLIQGGSRLND